MHASSAARLVSRGLSALALTLAALAGTVAFGGGCEAGSDTGDVVCAGVLLRCDATCVDPRHDPAHCGACNVACDEGMACVDGVCDVVCGGGASQCADQCVLLDRDPEHCGNCNNACDPGQACVDGECSVACFGGTIECGGECIDIEIDRLHCGGCEQPCADGEVCSLGVCDLYCGGTTEECDRQCVDSQADENNCGGCGISCGPGQICTSAICCEQGEVSCDGQCANLAVSTNHCGGCGNTCNGDESCQGGHCSDAGSCNDIKVSTPAATDGVYFIDPDGSGGEPPFEVYCDMGSDGGGWTLAARFSVADADNWMLDSGEWWFSTTAQAGAVTQRNVNADMLSAAFWTVTANELKISRTDNADDSFLLKTSGACLAGQTFRQKILSFNVDPSLPWAVDAYQGECLADFGANSQTTEGFAQATCSSNLQTAGRLSFFADWSAGDGSVMMIGGGGDGCSRADHGIGVTEANDASFNDGNSGEADFGNTPTPGVLPYSLNLFVR